MEIETDHIRTSEGAGSEFYDRKHEPMLIPVPRGMCPAFYQFMGAGAPRGDDGQIFMLNPRYRKGVQNGEETTGDDTTTEAERLRQF